MKALNSDSDFLMITTKVCYYCTRAKNILNAKNLTFTEIDGNKEPEFISMQEIKLVGEQYQLFGTSEVANLFL